jgi:hypothetical protein
MQVEMLEGLLRSGGAPLAESEDFQLVAEEFPEKVSTFSFQRQDLVMEALYGMVKEGLAGQEDFDVELLPEFDALRKYFGLAGSYSIPDEKGVFMSSFSFPKD